MSTELPAAPPPAAEEATEAGNYFVSNYPPFSFWQPEQIPAIARVLDQPPPEDVPVGASISPHRHPHSEEVLFIHAGTGTVAIT